jgi:hypothetical protein
MLNRSGNDGYTARPIPYFELQRETDLGSCVNDFGPETNGLLVGELKLERD